MHCSCSVVGIHQSSRIDPQEAGLLTGMQDHLHLNRISNHRLTVSGMGDSPRVDLDYFRIIGAVKLPVKEEFLTNPNVPVFHDLVIPRLVVTFHTYFFKCVGVGLTTSPP